MRDEVGSAICKWNAIKSKFQDNSKPEISPSMQFTKFSYAKHLPNVAQSNSESSKATTPNKLTNSPTSKQVPMTPKTSSPSTPFTTPTANKQLNSKKIQEKRNDFKKFIQEQRNLNIKSSTHHSFNQFTPVVLIPPEKSKISLPSPSNSSFFSESFDFDYFKNKNEKKKEKNRKKNKLQENSESSESESENSSEIEYSLSDTSSSEDEDFKLPKKSNKNKGKKEKKRESKKEANIFDISEFAPPTYLPCELNQQHSINPILNPHRITYPNPATSTTFYKPIPQPVTLPRGSIYSLDEDEDFNSFISHNESLQDSKPVRTPEAPPKKSQKLENSKPSNELMRNIEKMNEQLKNLNNQQIALVDSIGSSAALNLHIQPSVPILSPTSQLNIEHNSPSNVDLGAIHLLLENQQKQIESMQALINQNLLTAQNKNIQPSQSFLDNEIQQAKPQSPVNDAQLARKLENAEDEGRVKLEYPPGSHFANRKRISSKKWKVLEEQITSENFNELEEYQNIFQLILTKGDTEQILKLLENTCTYIEGLSNDNFLLTFDFVCFAVSNGVKNRLYFIL